MSFRKLFLAMAGISLVSGLAISFLIYGSMREERLAEDADHFGDSINFLGESYRALREKEPELTAEDAIGPVLQEMIDDEPDLLYVEIYGPNGDKLVSKIRPGFSPETSRDALKIRNVTRVAKGGGEYRFEAAFSMNTVNASLEKLKKNIAIACVIVVLLALAMSAWAGKLLLSKVRRIRAVVDDVAKSQDFSRRVDVGANAAESSDEVEALGFHFNRMFEAIASAQQAALAAEKMEAQAAVAAQVAHDIRSPLTSMTISLDQLTRAVGSQESVTALKSGIDRVTGILRKLNATYGKKAAEENAVETPKLTLLDKVLMDVVGEHRLKLKNPERLVVRGFPATPKLWSVIQVAEIQSAFSNIMNNAFEAVEKKGSRVTVEMTVGESDVVVTIADDGVGIPAAHLEKIFERKFTHGKATGTGLGLFQAKAAVEWSSGTLKVESKDGEGATFIMTLPLERKPSWIADEVQIKNGQKVVFLDDDPTILSLWKEKVAGLACEAKFYLSAAELEAAGPWPEGALLITDQYLGLGSPSVTGLHILARLGLKKDGHLCTSEYDDAKIQNEVRALGARLIPKPCLAQVQLKIV